MEVESSGLIVQVGILGISITRGFSWKSMPCNFKSSSQTWAGAGTVVNGNGW